ncbi:MAG: radical SAM protein [Bacteroidales bacterium]|nr:radical SAM protein [Bacteroidales bacterium]
MKKLSRYNYSLEKDGYYYLYNSLTGAVVRFDKNNYFFVTEKLNNLDYFCKNYRSLFEKFYKYGFIVDSNRDELKELIFKNKKAIFLDTEYKLFLHPTLDCNFNCWYCYEEHPKDYMSEDTKSKILKHIEYMTNSISGLDLCWFGGEPLMYYYEIVKPISEFSKELMIRNNKTFANSITTNGYLIDEKMIESFKQINLNKFQITIDGDKKRHDKIRRH